VRLFQRDRDFGVFFCTQGISNIGDAAWNVLIPLYVLQLTHNPLQVSAVAIGEAVAFGVLRMPFGALADRLEGRRLMVIWIVIIPVAAFSALFDSAAGVAVPTLVPPDRRGSAYAWQESLESLAWVIGPPLGGLLAVGFGPGEAVGLDSETFLVSVAGLLVIGRRFEPEPDAGQEPVWASVRSGLRLMIADRVLRRDQLIWSAYSILGGSIVLALVYVGTRGGRTSAGLATVAVAAYAAGSAGGALFGLGEGLVLVFHLTLRARVTPDGYFGRITGVAGVAGQITSGLSMAWLGLILRFAPGRPAFVVLAAAMAALAAGVAIAPRPPLA
jgi:MFS family permease